MNPVTSVRRDRIQALELIYLGREQPLGGTDAGGDGDGDSDGHADEAEPDELAYWDDQPVEAIGPDQARLWLENCFAGGTCEFDDFCINRGGYDHGTYDSERDLWVDCP